MGRACHERLLQTEILLRLNSLPIIALPIPNGVYLPARTEAERSMVARIITRMKSDGLLLPGAPDLCIFGRNGFGAMVELKRGKSRDVFGKITPAGRPSAAQTELAERAQRLGVRHAFVSSWEQMEVLLHQWGVAS